MIKRIFDLTLSFFGLIILSPIFFICLILVWVQDFHNPFYVAQRVGLYEKKFSMIKIRSMKVNADLSGVDSTANDDSRITLVGKIIRKFKIDELAQLINVFLGQMSFVGPRPNVERETSLYTTEEKKLLNLKPGITDISSIVFSDEGDILEGRDDPDITYNQLIRPGKSKLGIFYIENSNIFLDVYLIFLTFLSIISRQKALELLSKKVCKMGGNPELVELCKRIKPLKPMPPPGAKNIVTNREGKVE